MADAIEAMVRQGISLRQASTQLQITLTTTDCETLQRRRSFQKLLQAARLRYHNEIGSDPGLTKTALIGKLLLLSDKLMDEGEWDKAGEVLFKVAKIRGDVGADSSVNVFGNLSAKDYADIRKNLEGKDDKPRSSSGSSEVVPIN